MIHVGLITTLGRMREVDRDQVKALADSIKEVGLLNPITVYPRKIVYSGQTVDGYGLVAGAHRLEAIKSLGWQEVPAIVVDLDENDRTIAECDENLCGSKLTAAEKAMFTAKRKEAYLAKYPETRNGSNQHTRVRKVCEGSPADRFTADTAAKTGASERTIQLDAERGEKISNATLALLKGTHLDTGRYLDQLKGLSPEDQIARVKTDLARREPVTTSRKSKIDADVKSRAAKEVAEMMAEHVPGEWWDALKANLYAAGASNIAHEFTNITGQSLMGREWS